MSSYLDEACQGIIQLDETIRFAGIASMDWHKIMKLVEPYAPIVNYIASSNSST